MSSKYCNCRVSLSLSLLFTHHFQCAVVSFHLIVRPALMGDNIMPLPPSINGEDCPVSQPRLFKVISYSRIGIIIVGNRAFTFSQALAISCSGTNGNPIILLADFHISEPRTLPCVLSFYGCTAQNEINILANMLPERHLLFSCVACRASSKSTVTVTRLRLYTVYCIEHAVVWQKRHT